MTSGKMSNFLAIKGATKDNVVPGSSKADTSIKKTCPKCIDPPGLFFLVGHVLYSQGTLPHTSNHIRENSYVHSLSEVHKCDSCLDHIHQNHQLELASSFVLHLQICEILDLVATLGTTKAIVLHNQAIAIAILATHSTSCLRGQ